VFLHQDQSVVTSVFLECDTDMVLFVFWVRCDKFYSALVSNSYPRVNSSHINPTWTLGQIEQQVRLCMNHPATNPMEDERYYG
jgi:hypothetical protein